MFEFPPVEAAKPNLKVGGTAPFMLATLGMSSSVSFAAKILSPSKSKATERRLGVAEFGGANVI
jgi:hypothetical protein